MRHLMTSAAALVMMAGTAVVAGEPGMGETKIPDALMDRVREGGLVRVLVSVAHDTDAARATGLDCVNDACAKLTVQNVMLPDEAPVVEPLEGLPLIVMEVTEAGLQTLERAPHVVSVAADEAVPGSDVGGLAEPTGG